MTRNFKTYLSFSGPEGQNIQHQALCADPPGLKMEVRTRVRCLTAPARAMPALWACLLVATGCLGLVGCSKQKMADVAGRVVYDTDGTAATDLVGYRVSFLSSHEAANGKKKRITATGKVGKDGKFTMSTYAMNDGVLLGTHQIALTPPVQLSPDSGPRKPLIAPRFGDPEQSGLTATVDGDTKVVLKVEHTP